MANKIKQDISIGANLKRLRKPTKMSQEQVVAKLELSGISMSREVFSKIEQGRYSIKVSVLLALKELYHVDSFDEFFKDLVL